MKSFKSPSTISWDPMFLLFRGYLGEQWLKPRLFAVPRELCYTLSCVGSGDEPIRIRSWNVLAKGFVSMFPSNYSDLTRPHPKWWFRKGNLLFQGNLGWRNIIIWPEWCSGDFVLICVDGSIEEAQDFVKEIGLSNKIIVATVVDENAPMQYQVSGLPHHTLIAPDGSSSLVQDTTKKLIWNLKRAIWTTKTPFLGVPC